MTLVSPNVTKGNSNTGISKTILLEESGIPLMIGIGNLTATDNRNPGSTDKDYNPVPGIRNSLLGIQNPRLSWIRLLGVKNLCFSCWCH